MPSRTIVALGFLLLTFGAATQVSAEFLWGFFGHVARETKSRQCWPEPYVSQDRAIARSAFCTMVNNGWRRQNMLSRFHFDQATGQLNEAGRNKVRWIIYECPRQHRLIYIHIGETEEETLARRVAVEELIARSTPDNPPPVLTTSISEDGWPAEQADLIGRKYMSSTPPPRLPTGSSQDGAGGSGGSY
ncbi:MAG: hypothetical protein GX594_15660 [Pirellulaceae bacterium]|nr:hypothetical protein [Pirellulaceae bacterium]